MRTQIYIRKPTPKESSNYDGLRDLYRVAELEDGMNCAIEQLEKSNTNGKMRYEVLAPQGYRFDGDLASMLGTSLSDIKDRLSQSSLEEHFED